MGNEVPGPTGIHEALTRHTGFLVSRMGHVAQKGFLQRISTIGLTPRQWGALNVLDVERSITQGALGKAIGMDPSTLVGTVDELEAKGFVERRPHPGDRRAHDLHLTSAGRDALKRGRALAREAQEELLAPLNRRERQQLHELLLRLAMASRES